MKKGLVLLFALALFCGVAGNASALVITDVVNFSAYTSSPATAIQQVNFDDLYTGYGGQFVNKIESGFDFLSYYHRWDFEPDFVTINSATLKIALRDDADKWYEYGAIWQSGSGWNFGGEINTGTYSVGNIDLGLLEDGDFHIDIYGATNWQWGLSDFFVDSSTLTIDYAPVPEPGTLLLLGSGLAGLAFYRRKKMK